MILFIFAKVKDHEHLYMLADFLDPVTETATNPVRRRHELLRLTETKRECICENLTADLLTVAFELE